MDLYQSKSNRSQMKQSLFIIILFIFTSASAFSQFAAFTQVDKNSVASEPDITPINYSVFSTDELQLQNFADSFSEKVVGSSEKIQIPYPDGSLKTFTAEYAPVIHPDLAARYPDIKTFRLRDDEGRISSGRMSITEHGTHIFVRGRNYTLFVNPYSAEIKDYSISFYSQKVVRSYSDLMNFDQREPYVYDQQELDDLLRNAYENPIPLSSGENLRTYRIAIAANRFYTSARGGTVESALAAIVVALNRITEIFEREVAISFELVANNDEIIFTNANPGPIGNLNSPSVQLLTTNQTTLDNIIGSANYDIGHIFITGGGGVAYTPSVCNNNIKAGGISGLNNPIGDPFVVNIVAHEMGHQFGAPHSFNGSTGGCAQNITPVGAYEPGSGSTIMAYAGLCPGQNMQFNADDYFHTGSYSVMRSYITTGLGSTCGTTSSTGNNPPVVNIDTESLVVPISTPFVLRGDGSDPDGDEVTFTWEQFDRGPQGNPNQPVGNAPLFRTFPGTTTPDRTFPRMQDVLSGTQTLGELLPTYQRNLTFRLTARDNNAGGGGVAFDQVQHTTTENAGPFVVPVPGPDTEWPTGGSVFVAWDVANTNVAPVNAQLVNIYLSTNSGDSFDELLAENVPNNGFAEVILPDVTTTNARIKVEAADHIFFNVNPANFSIQPSPPSSEINLSFEEFELDLSDVDVSNFELNVSNTGDNTLNYFASIVENEDSDLPFLPTENIKVTNQAGAVRENQNRNIEFELNSDDLTEGVYSFMISLLTDNPNQPTINIPVIVNVRIQQEFSNLFTGQDGWRLIGTPAENAMLTSIFRNFRTQGFTGADEESDDLLPNVYTRGTSGLNPVSNIDTQVDTGRAIAAYLFANQLPRIMRVQGFENIFPLGVNLQNNLVFPLPGVDGSQERGWNLLANPYRSSFDLSTFKTENLVNVNRTFYVWRANLNDNRGGFQLWNGLDVVDLPQYFNGTLSQFDAFYIQTSGNNAQVIFDDPDQIADEPETNQLNQDLDYAYYTLEISGQGFTNYATILTTNESTSGVDLYDAVQLRSLSGEYLTLYTPHSNRPFVIRSLPLNYDGGSITLPYQVESTESGEFSIRLLGTGGSITNFENLELTDNVTGETVALQVGDSYTFEMDATGEAPEGGVNQLANLAEHQAVTSDSRFSVTIVFGTDTNIEDDGLNPLSYDLAQNYPNPFNPTTQIQYNLPEGSMVNLEVYDMLGRRVATLVNSAQAAGTHAVQFDAANLSSGVYIYRLQTDMGVLTRKMMLVK